MAALLHLRGMDDPVVVPSLIATPRIGSAAGRRSDGTAARIVRAVRSR
jgi:hypothetical protein